MTKKPNKFEIAKSWLVSIITGDIILRLRVDKAFLLIIYLLLLGWLNIFLNYKAESSMMEQENNKVELENLKIYHAQKTCEYVSLYRISTVEEILRGMNSNLKAPEKPADILIED